MPFIRNFKTFIKAFQADKSGNLAITTALLVPVVFGTVGLVMDYSRMSNVKTSLDNALDSAVLASGNNLSRGMKVDAKFKKQFEDTLRANIVGRSGIIPDYKITHFSADEKTGKISARVEGSVKASFVRVLGYNDLDIASHSEAIFSQTDTEIAMMLDITGSMQGQKIADLKSAAKSAIDILLSNTNKKTTRVALVPYGSSVNAGKYASKVTKGNDLVAVAGLDFANIGSNVKTNSCVTERGGREAASDAFYKVARIGSDTRTVNGVTLAHKCPTSKIMPLTNNRGKLKKEINKMVARGATAGHLGVAWSYYLLSGKWGGLWKSNAAKPYSKDVKKIAIIMTDGEFNTFYDGVKAGNGLSFNQAPFGPREAESSQLARRICANMKSLKNGNPGITIYSVAFAAPATAQKLLKDCANTDTKTQKYYYSAKNGKELKVAFKEIAESIQQLRLSR